MEVVRPLVSESDDKDKKDEEKDSALDRALKTRTLLISGAIDNKNAEKIIRQVLLLEDDNADEPITVILNSPGGSVTDGMAIYDILRFIKPRVRMVCTGLTASIATIILLAAEKEDRLSLPSTRFLIHQPLIMGQVMGPASDLEITANEIIKTRGVLNKMLAEGTGKDLKRIEKDVERDYWMRSDEALEYGLISGIIQNREDLD
jgi:ATP-dependent Clp protease, protease subunit